MSYHIVTSISQLNLSEVLTQTRKVFMQMVNCDASSDLIEHRLTRDEFQRQLAEMGLRSRDETGEWFTWMDTNQTGSIDLLDWDRLMQPNLKLSKLLKIPRIEVRYRTKSEIIGIYQTCLRVLSKNKMVNVFGIGHCVWALVKHQKAKTKNELNNPKWPKSSQTPQKEPKPPKTSHKKWATSTQKVLTRFGSFSPVLCRFMFYECPLCPTYSH